MTDELNPPLVNVFFSAIIEHGTTKRDYEPSDTMPVTESLLEIPGLRRVKISRDAEDDYTFDLGFDPVEYLGDISDLGEGYFSSQHPPDQLLQILHDGDWGVIKFLIETALFPHWNPEWYPLLLESPPETTGEGTRA